MGTPRASGFVDQMRRMQINASVGGECTANAALGRRDVRATDSELGAIAKGNATLVALTL